MASNMYRVGDYVYFETSSTSPYQIRRIEELNKTPNGNVEAKVMCFYRRRDISSSLIMLADKHQNGHGGTWDLCGGLKKLLKSQDTQGTPLIEGVTSEASQQDPPVLLAGALEEDESDSDGGEVGGGASIITPTGESLSPQERHQLRHRELFLSRQIETLPATHIRGKCTVTLLNETELLLAYLNKDDTFFYSLVYDPQQKTLLADKGEIRVGSRFQADITSLMKEGETDGRNLEELESLVWTPCHGLTDRQIDQFLVMSRSVGTFARALDCSSSVKQPSLHMSAAAASRDVTLFHAMDTLHKHNYDISKALCSLIPATGPVLCRDEMEEWSASEANLFEEALEKYGKDFNDIRQDFLPWKTLKNIIEYYYMWKTTDRYVQQKRVKAVEAESKLKQVYIPNYNKPNPAALSNGKTSTTTTTTTTTSTSSVSSTSSTMVNGADVSVSGKACESCHATSSSQWYAWGPSHLQCRLCNSCWQYWKKFGGLKLPSRIGKEEDGSLIYTPVPNKDLPVVNNTSPTLLKRRTYEEINGMDESELEEGLPPSKRQKDIEGGDSIHLNQLGVVPPPGLTVTPVGVNGGPGVPTPPLGAPNTPSRAKIATVSRVGGRPRIISWMDAPDDVYFYATDTTKKLRKSLTTNDLKRAARRPWKKIQDDTAVVAAAAAVAMAVAAPTVASPQFVE
ncbi:metastasis-associated protein MTA1-like isoform X7 [Eriocheir sinensis]|uniref:metastasis-associated protein MTA1-like isoform X7 n=1 Tax=Eriocheir sinensis TaxID=95602 RepID=UPI0021C76957|nr:metastasis-associated protein MTA1-like isoform X7 [Eriocheir sinensis]